MKRQWLWLLGCLLLVAVGLAVGRSFLDLQAVSETPHPVREAVVQREVVLFFGDPQTRYLLDEVRPVADAPDELLVLRHVIEALIEGPRGELLPVLPSQAHLLDLSQAADELVLDFDQALIDYHPGGSSSELLTIHALTNTVAANFPTIRRLRLKVDGQPLVTLKGHVDLSLALEADFSLIRQTVEAEIPQHGQLPESLTVGEQTNEFLPQDPQ
ncbi:MAG: GerMN domain-containing protein [Desulfuromonadaceae bacterium]|nr:GerMN domain-containing protein [Desulfuromonadaceae bacterium]